MGFNGKIIVILLIMYILQKLGFNVIVVGNVGLLVLDLLYYDVDILVFELFSFQLEIICSLVFFVGVILNILVDYFDCYYILVVYSEVK